MRRIPDLHLEDDGSVSFSDERSRAGEDLPDGSFASLTMTSWDGDRSWGTFLRRDEALQLYGWLGLLLSQPLFEAPGSEPSSPGPTNTEQESE